MSDLLPDDWSSKPLSKVINKLIDFRGRTPRKLGMEWGNGNIRALSANNVQMGKVNFNKECYLASEELYENWMTKGDTEKGDVLFTMEAPLGNVALVPDDDKYILSQRVILLKAVKEEMTSEFLFQQLRSDAFQDILRENATGSTALGIQQKRLVTLDITIPPLPEQQKIAAILTSVDEVIEKTQAQIDKLKDLKTAMMQELLTCGVGIDGKPHTEFKDTPVGRIPKEWEVSPIGDLFHVQLGKMLSKASKIGNKPYPYLGNKNVQWGDVDLTNLETMDFKDAERKKFSLLKGDLLMCEGGDVGRTAIWQGEMSNCYYQKAIHRLRPIESSYEPFLLMEYMRYAKKTGLLVDYISQTSIAHLTKEKLISIPLPVPSVQEQQKIVCILKSITGKINLSATTLQKNKVLKKALMQDLLTGKVRVTVPAPSSPKASKPYSPKASSLKASSHKAIA
jgi:type I restriction enzyme S subunit